MNVDEMAIYAENHYLAVGRDQGRPYLENFTEAWLAYFNNTELYEANNWEPLHMQMWIAQNAFVKNVFKNVNTSNNT